LEAEVDPVNDVFGVSNKRVSVGVHHSCYGSTQTRDSDPHKPGFWFAANAKAVSTAARFIIDVLIFLSLVLLSLSLGDTGELNGALVAGSVVVVTHGFEILKL